MHGSGGVFFSQSKSTTRSSGQVEERPDRLAKPNWLQLMSAPPIIFGPSRVTDKLGSTFFFDIHIMQISHEIMSKREKKKALAFPRDSKKKKKKKLLYAYF
ncbi:hypothetical protein TWF102_005472 [Orbilia oligospora]|uniref:Uncharacterized protein n=1 Tax=Orbilia oligospora TaxID=2813651 RepID=A0A7C8N8G4_ORBOL|nr:hypothetical protein TWF103_002595 [Orbilia oligospora]KAF3099499.1 hypothetical protein TWF102_005472 [Orbilia oligospora]